MSNLSIARRMPVSHPEPSRTIPELCASIIAEALGDVQRDRDPDSDRATLRIRAEAIARQAVYQIDIHRAQQARERAAAQLVQQLDNTDWRHAGPAQKRRAWHVANLVINTYHHALMTGGEQ